MKTREEVEKLKQDWHKDASWDIENTEGFDEYKNELKGFSVDSQVAWKKQREREHKELESKFCPMCFNNNQFEQHCCVELCAWWNSMVNKCGAIVAFPEN